MANERKTVMISSTARDLPEHRKEVMDACLRQGMFPDMMEHLPASDADAIRVSLEMVNRADIYLGIFAYRYGYVPKQNNPKRISVTEMEYNRAVERNIPRLIFIMHDDHPLRASDVETGEGAEKLKKFKDRLRIDRVAGFFKSPVDLRSQIIQGLVPYRESDVTQFHYVSDIPKPPEAYIAHPYTLLQTRRLIGRQNELNLLTSWVTKKQDEIYWTRILSIVAIGGMGKSALTWKWFNEIAHQEMKPLAGRMWWSFYESDATFENFVIRALAYVSKRSREDIEKNTKPDEREEQLLQILDREPYLLVLDGLERILIAYARMDAARLSDDDIDQRTANFVAEAFGLPESAGQSFVGQHQLRKTTNPRAGLFLRKLANVRSARILISTRLYPADLQSVTGDPVRGCSATFLPGLNDDDALNLWRAFRVSGSREMMLPLFHRFEKHPLLMQSLASEVANYRRAPGDFERWQNDHPNFDPFSLPMTQVKGHVLEFAMQGLYKNARKVLETIAGFRMPAHYDTLAAIFVGEGKLFPTELGLDQALKELEDRGLLGWDKRANRYDLHPIVRGVVWGRLSNKTRNNVLTSLQEHFDSIPKIDDWRKIRSIEDITSVIELYNTLIGLGRYEDALFIFVERVFEYSVRLGAYRQIIEILESAFPTVLEESSAKSEKSHLLAATFALALAYQHTGQVTKAINFHEILANLQESTGIVTSLSIWLSFRADAKCLAGQLNSSQWDSFRSISIAREKSSEDEAFGLTVLGLAMACRGELIKSEFALRRALKINSNDVEQGIPDKTLANLGQLYLWTGNVFAQSIAERVEKMAIDSFLREEMSIKGIYLQGNIALNANNFTKADERLHLALTRARTVNYVEEELPTLIALAELKKRQGDLRNAREYLDSVWEYAERGPYQLFHADALNILVEIEREEGNTNKAIEAATKAYYLAWCDGPPYAYYWGLKKAKKYLQELGAPEPEMPPFDGSKFQPMLEVDINPHDEYWIDPDKEFDFDEIAE
jgi:tetratricopeptide (TPR) repeat protein